MMPFPAALMGKVGSAPASATSSQWRLLFPTGTSTNAAQGNAVNIFEVEMRASVGGADQCSGGTASASSEFSGSFPASKAFDNLTNAQWASTNAASRGSWLQYTFAFAVSVNEVAIYCGTVGFPTSFRLQYYDGAQWVTHLAQDGQLTWSVSGWQYFAYSAPFVEPTGYTSWRMLITVAAASTYSRIAEFELREAPGGSDVNFGVTASAAFATSPASNAVDNSTSTFWDTNQPVTGGTGNWLQIDYARKVNAVEVTLRNGGGSDKAPTGFDIQYYDTGTASWVTSWSVTGQTWTTAETRVFTKP